MYKVKVEKGPQDAIPQLAGGTTLVAKKSFAEDQKLKVGEAVTLRTPTRKKLTLRVGGIVKDEGGLIADYAVSNADARPRLRRAQGRDRARRRRARAPTRAWSRSG